MGSMITLRLGRLEVNWGKNSFFRNHSCLFSKNDLAMAEYFYADDHVVEQPAYVRKLRRVVERLELLGHTLEGCRESYATAQGHVPNYYPKVTIDFDVFRQALCAVNLDRVRNAGYDPDYDLGEFACYVLQDPEFNRVADGLSSAVTRDDGTFFENLDCYVILRLLAENPANLDRELVWGFHDVVEGGYVENDDVYEPLSDATRFLDFSFGPKEAPAIRWTSYSQECRAYQGELAFKEVYTKLFFERVNKDGYNLDKLQILWGHILQACSSEASSV